MADKRGKINHKSLVRHVQDMQGQINRVMTVICEHTTEAQPAQWHVYHQPDQLPEFQSGERVLVPMPKMAPCIHYCLYSVKKLPNSCCFFPRVIKEAPET